MVAVCGSIGGVDWLPTILYSIYAVIITIITILCWVFYDELQKLVYVQLLTTATEKGIKEMTKKEKGKDKYLKNHPQEQVFNHSLIRYNQKFEQEELARKDTLRKNSDDPAGKVGQKKGSYVQLGADKESEKQVD